MITKEQASFANHPSALSFIGQVVSNTDEHKRGRVRVIIPRYNTESEFWAYPISPILGGGSGTPDNPSTSSWGFYGAPQVGDHVLMIALDGDMNTLFYIGCVNSKNQNLPEAKESPDNLQLRMANGHTLIFRTGSDTSIELKSASGANIIIDDANSRIKLTKGSSSITIDGSGNITASASGNAVVTAGGDANITATGNVNISGTTVNLNP